MHHGQTRSLCALLLTSIALVTTGCAREEEKARSALEKSMNEVEARLADGAAEAEKALDAAMKRWDELRPKAEKAVARLEDRVDELARDAEALSRLPPETLERVRARIKAMREKLAEAQAAHEQGNTDLAVEKADAVQQERAAVEELLVERPDAPTQGSEVR